MTENLSYYTIFLELGESIIRIILERFRAPLIVERIVDALPQSSRVYISHDKSYVYIPISLERIMGISSRVSSLRKGEVGFMAFNQSLVICLKEFQARHPLMLIGRVEDERSLRPLEKLMRSVEVKIYLQTPNL